MVYIIISILVIVVTIKFNLKSGWIFPLIGVLSYNHWFDGYVAALDNPIGRYILWFISIGVGIYLMFWIKRFNKTMAESQKPDPNEDIRYENRTNIPHGFIFGERNNEYIIKPENKDGHIMVVGGAGSGKSSCLAIPTLRAWKNRVFAIDIKGELYENTKLQRKNIKVFNPQDKDSYGYDPFFALKTSDNPVQEASMIAEALIPISPKDESFWLKGARSLFVGAMLHYYKDYSFLETLTLIKSYGQRELITQISESPNHKAQLYIRNFVDASERTLSGFFLELSTRIDTIVGDNDLISALSREKNISPLDLENNQDVYICIPQNVTGIWSNMLTLMINQFLKFFEERPENKEPILFLLDEFPALGKITSVVNGVATLRSRKITIAIIIQDISQLDEIYGRDSRNTIVGNCSYKAILSVEDGDTQEYFSKMIGTYDKKQKSESKGYGFSAFGLMMNRGEQTSLIEKRRFKPETLALLPKYGCLVLLSPFGNFLVEKKPYYEDDNRDNNPYKISYWDT